MQGTAVLEWTQHHLKWEKIMVRLYKEVDLKDIRAQERERKREKKERKRERHRIKENNAFIGGILEAILDLLCALVTCFLFIYCWLAPTDCDLLLLTVYLVSIVHDLVNGWIMSLAHSWGSKSEIWIWTDFWTEKELKNIRSTQAQCLKQTVKLARFWNSMCNTSCDAPSTLRGSPIRVAQYGF